MTNELDQKLNQLKTLEENLTKISEEKETIRKEVFEILEKENLGQYKNEIATISRVERKTIKYTKPIEEILKNLEEQKLVKYFSIVPEHKEINSNFEKDVKGGIFNLDGIEIKTSTSPMIRFN